MMYQKKTSAWTPQLGTQTDAITATWCEELFFGGARGGGKTSYLLGDFAQGVSNWGKDWKGILFRKTLPELANVIEQSKKIYPSMGAIYKETKKTWHFSNGAILKFRSMEREQDADKYQGHEYTWIGFDELPNWKDDKAYLKLKACLRSPAGVSVKRIRATGNPGGVGHMWVKHRFIDPAPQGYEPIDEMKYINFFTGEQSQEPMEGKNWASVLSTRMFIPSKIQDNQILLQNDPNYIARLAQTGSVELVKAWLGGDWNAIQGAYFDSWSNERHVVDWFEIPRHWTRIRSMDWGFSKPFSIHWWAISDGSPVKLNGEKVIFPKDAMICYREWYGMEAQKPNVGLRLGIKKIAEGIKNKEEPDEVRDAILDPACWDYSTGESIAEQFYNNGIGKEHYRGFNPADNKRIPGWQQVRHRLRNNLLFIMKHCIHLIRTIPVMQHDDKDYEDLDTDLEDHAVDDMRYACMSRPITTLRAEVEPMRIKPIGADFLKAIRNDGNG
jgi:hypothetical protein